MRALAPRMCAYVALYSVGLRGLAQRKMTGIHMGTDDGIPRHHEEQQSDGKRSFVPIA
jgi:hypothetical protein